MKTKIIILTVFLSAFLKSSYSQVSTEWISSYHFASEEGKALVLDDSGNVYVTGASSGDIATVKYNSSGIQKWAIRFNGAGNNTDRSNDIAVDDSGNVYVTGESYSFTSNSDFVTIKYNSSGIQQWVRYYNGTAFGNDAGFSVDVDASGNVFVTGYSFGSTSSFNYTTIKYNAAGALQWVKDYNGTGNGADYANKLCLDQSGNVYVTGSSKGSSTSDDDYVTIKYNTAGVEQWVRIYQGEGDAFDQPQSIAVDNASNIYVTGRSFGNGTLYDFATIKYNSSGDSLWVKRYNGVENNFDYGIDVAVDLSGNVYVFGQSLNAASNYDFVTVKYNSSGVFQWDKTFNGPGNDVDNAFDMCLDDSGNVYVTGSSNLVGQNYNYATVKYSSTGIERWNKIYNGPASGSDESFSIAADHSGDIYITGGSASLAQFKDFVTIKYSQKPYAQITGLIEGFYNPSFDKMVSDTVSVIIRNISSPYAIVDSSKRKCDSSGTCNFYFTNISDGINYYIVLKHRNSIQTWSSSGNFFAGGTMTYDFTTSSGQAYGSNQKQVDTSPVEFAIYSGDVNQDESVDLTDIVTIYNDANNFISGYVVTDINGDDFADLTDLTIAFNNSNAFVNVVRP